MMILEDYLERNAQRHPQKTAVVCEGKAYTYKTLLDMVLTRTEAMKKLYRPGQAVALRAMPMADYLADYFALHRAGCVAVPLERDIPETKFQEITRRLSDISTPEGTADILYTTGTTGQSKGVMISHRTIVADAENLIDGQGFTHELAFVVNGPMNHIGSLSKVYPVIMVGATLIIVDGLKDMNRF
jgi:acyl-CoA synthetase (AMP-forming)/AMP-acid ligase II